MLLFRYYRIRRFVSERRMVIISACVALLIMLTGYVTYLSLPPSGFPQDNGLVSIKKGMYMSQAADTLEKNGVIRSPLLFKVLVVLISGHRQVQAGDYLFNQPQSAFQVAYRAVNGIQGLPKIKITVFEGMTTQDIGAILKKNIPKFDVQTFLALAKPLEGYLFPDTYFFYQNSTPQDVVSMMHDTFIQKMKTVLLQAQAFGKPMSEIVTMASIVEREATSSTDRRMIAGVLWNRISKNMPLQVDPTLYYLLGKDSAHLTLTDLAIDSPYNLYKHTGLPPTPIDNPGLSAIIDTMTPTKSKYVFFLSGRDGVMHYAETLSEHIANKNKYM